LRTVLSFYLTSNAVDVVLRILNFKDVNIKDVGEYLYCLITAVASEHYRKYFFDRYLADEKFGIDKKQCVFDVSSCLKMSFGKELYAIISDSSNYLPLVDKFEQCSLATNRVLDIELMDNELRAFASKRWLDNEIRATNFQKVATKIPIGSFLKTTLARMNSDVEHQDEIDCEPFDFELLRIIFNYCDTAKVHISPEMDVIGRRQRNVVYSVIEAGELSYLSIRRGAKFDSMQEWYAVLRKIDFLRHFSICYKNILD